MVDQGRSDFCVVFAMSHCALSRIKTNVNKFGISNHTAFKLDVKALRNYLSLICEYELHILPNKKVSTAKDRGKNYMKDRPPPSIKFTDCTSDLEFLTRGSKSRSRHEGCEKVHQTDLNRYPMINSPTLSRLDSCRIDGKSLLFMH